MASPGPFNPYAPPSDLPAPGAPGGFEGYGVWQENGQVALYANSGRLPNRCAVCNGHAQHRISKTFYWHEPWLYLLILAGWLVYAIVAMIVRKSATVEYWLCDEHRKRRTLGLALVWGGFAAGFIGMLVAAGASSGAVAVVFAVVMLVLPIVGGIMAKMVSPARITDVEVRLKAGEAFVASLPASPQMGQLGYGGRPGGYELPPMPRW
jgi:hypothetical protein